MSAVFEPAGGTRIRNCSSALDRRLDGGIGLEGLVQRSDLTRWRFLHFSTERTKREPRHLIMPIDYTQRGMVDDTGTAYVTITELASGQPFP